MICGQPLLDFFFPVGRTIETASADDNPNVKYNSNGLKSTWVLTHIGRCPVGIDINDTDFNVIGKQIGEKKHKQTLDELCAHSHNTNLSAGTDTGTNRLITSSWSWDTKNQQNSGLLNLSGGGQPFNIVQPSEVAYFWKRTA